MTIDEPTDITQELLAAGVELLTTKLPAGHLPVRLLAFSVHDLGGAGDVHGQLFGEQDRDKERQLDQVADAIAAKFGTAAIRRGARPGGEKDCPLWSTADVDRSVSRCYKMSAVTFKSRRIETCPKPSHKN